MSNLNLIILKKNFFDITDLQLKTNINHSFSRKMFLFFVCATVWQSSSNFLVANSNKTSGSS